jgi:hypothetical protein
MMSKKEDVGALKEKAKRKEETNHESEWMEQETWEWGNQAGSL